MPNRESFQPKFRVERFHGGMPLDSHVTSRMSGLFNEIFTPIIRENAGVVRAGREVRSNRTYMETDISYPETTIVLLREQPQNAIVGFSYTYPATSETLSDTKFTEREVLGMTHQEYADLLKHTVMYGATLILPGFRGQGGWEAMMDALDEGVVESERFTSMTRYVRTAGGYADKVQARYPRMRYSADVSSIFGPQRYMRFDV